MQPQMRASAPPRRLVTLLRIGGYLIASLHTGLDDGQLASFRRAIVDEVGRGETRGVVIDLGAVDVLDSFACFAVGRSPRWSVYAAPTPSWSVSLPTSRSRW